MSSSNETIRFSRRVGEMTWFERILLEFPESVNALGIELNSACDLSLPEHHCEMFPCPDECSWFIERGCKFRIKCIEDCANCITQFLLDPNVYKYTTLGGDDPFLETERKLAT